MLICKTKIDTEVDSNVGALNLQGMKFAKKRGGNCKERKI